MIIAIMIIVVIIIIIVIIVVIIIIVIISVVSGSLERFYHTSKDVFSSRTLDLSSWQYITFTRNRFFSSDNKDVGSLLL